jgi:hypothetical protein
LVAVAKRRNQPLTVVTNVSKDNKFVVAAQLGDVVASFAHMHKTPATLLAHEALVEKAGLRQEANFTMGLARVTAPYGCFPKMVKMMLAMGPFAIGGSFTSFLKSAGLGHDYPIHQLVDIEGASVDSC